MATVAERPRTTPDSVAAWLSDRVQGDIGAAGGVPAGAAAAPGSDLSSDQISPKQQEEDKKAPSGPHLKYAQNGRFVSVKIPTGNPGRPGVRQEIKGFSHRARRALLNRVNSIDQQQAQPGHFAFVTLTYDKDFPTAAASKIDLDRFMKRMEREHGLRWIIWKLEPQLRGAPHYHLLVHVGSSFDAGKLCDWVARAWYDLVGNNNPDHLKFHLGLLGNLPCVEQVRDWQGVANYAGKYLGKLSQGDEEWQHPGKFWGQRRSDLAPITMITTEIPPRPAILIRRTCIRFYERQLTGWYYESGKRTSRGKDKPGRRMHKRELAPGGDLSKLTAAYLADRADELERPIRAQRRRWKGRKGGWSGYMNASTFERIAQWAAVESQADAMAASGGRLESDSTGQGICSSQFAQEQQAKMACTPAALARGGSAGRPYAMPASQRRPVNRHPRHVTRG